MNNILIKENFLRDKECEDILRIIKSKDTWMEEKDFWNDRLIDMQFAEKTFGLSLAKKMLEIGQRVKYEIINKYNPADLYCDSVHIVRWFDGQDQHPHLDDLSDQGKSGSWANDRIFGSVIYLNDNYSGGHTFYPEFDLDVVPKMGTLVVHPAYHPYTHGVSMITNDQDSLRYTISSFWSKDKDREEQYMRIGMI